ncbi:hypothetical protein AArcSl_1908 [Halalkaliarchaeum desulfuricum]|uniref:Uncharacterized protein n=1 Tax=Halalkaliarchaeum desulfuricum TaxID=2055893 RepID=A0A343TKB2_9EURY|nr:hypothetical protein AArcSl_1908 [Halalkaliarchaeum desulfuricum]
MNRQSPVSDSARNPGLTTAMIDLLVGDIFSKTGTARPYLMSVQVYFHPGYEKPPTGRMRTEQVGHSPNRGCVSVRHAGTAVHVHRQNR